MTRRTTGGNNTTISRLRGVSVPIVSQTEIDPMKTALSPRARTTTALTEPPPQSRRVRAPLSSLDCGPAMVPLTDVSSSRHSEPAERCPAEHVIALIRGEYRKDTLVGVV